MLNDVLQAKANREWKVLLVDVDRTCLMILQKMLRTLNYHVTTCQSATKATSILQEDRTNFDLLIIDVCTRDMEGSTFMKHICEQTDLPVIVTSSDDEEEVVKKWFMDGACDYLVKPIRVENVRHIWMNVYRAQRHGLIKKVEQSWSNSEINLVKNEANDNSLGDYDQKISDNNSIKSSNNGDYRKCMKKRKEDYEEVNDDYYVTNYSRKKQRVIWTPELHQKFVAAVHQFGNSKAVPKKILEVMNVRGLTRENVASHLQKYRQYQKQLEQRTQQGSVTSVNFTTSMSPTTYCHVLPKMSITGLEDVTGATNINTAAIVVDEHGEGISNVMYHYPLGSYATSAIDDSKTRFWSTFSTEDDNVKNEANYAYDYVLDSGYNL